MRLVAKAPHPLPGEGFSSNDASRGSGMLRYARAETKLDTLSSYRRRQRTMTRRHGVVWYDDGDGGNEKERELDYRAGSCVEYA